MTLKQGVFFGVGGCFGLFSFQKNLKGLSGKGAGLYSNSRSEFDEGLS